MSNYAMARWTLFVALFTALGCMSTRYPASAPENVQRAMGDRTSSTAVIAGRLTEVRTGEPIVAQVLLMPPGGRITLAETRADLQGFFVFTGVRPDAYRLVVSEGGLGGDQLRQIRVRSRERLFLEMHPTQVFRVRM